MALTISSTEYGYHVTGDTSGTVTTDKVRVKSFIFTPVAGANDVCVITDGKDREIVKFVGAVQNDSLQIDLYECPVDGLKISSMTDATDLLTILIA
jgi:hypothetical protein